MRRKASERELPTNRLMHQRTHLLPMRYVHCSVTLYSHLSLSNSQTLSLVFVLNCLLSSLLLCNRTKRIGIAMTTRKKMKKRRQGERNEDVQLRRNDKLLPKKLHKKRPKLRLRQRHASLLLLPLPPLQLLLTLPLQRPPLVMLSLVVGMVTMTMMIVLPLRQRFGTRRTRNRYDRCCSTLEPQEQRMTLLRTRHLRFLPLCLRRYYRSRILRPLLHCQ